MKPLTVRAVFYPHRAKGKHLGGYYLYLPARQAATKRLRSLMLRYLGRSRATLKYHSFKGVRGAYLTEVSFRLGLAFTETAELQGIPIGFSTSTNGTIRFYLPKDLFLCSVEQRPMWGRLRNPKQTGLRGTWTITLSGTIGTNRGT